MELLGVLGIVLAMLILLGWGAWLALILLDGIRRAKPKGHQTPSDRFAEDAEQLHRLMHPDDTARLGRCFRAQTVTALSSTEPVVA